MNVMTIFIGIVILFLAGMCFVNAFKLKKMRDRCNQVVFIGKGYEKSEIVKLLYECIEKAD